MVIGGLVFDIDDTLYRERDYVRSGFAHVARIVARSGPEATELSRWLWQAFETGIRGDTLDRMLMAFPEAARQASALELIEAYRTHHPDIFLAPGVELMLDELKDLGLRLGILSDGPAESQAAKVAALRLARWFDPIILTGSLGPDFVKPGTTGFEAIARAWRLPARSLVYVADNPEKDFVGPRALGWMTVRFREPEQLRHGLEPGSEAHRADVEIGAPLELLELVRGWTRRGSAI